MTAKEYAEWSKNIILGLHHCNTLKMCVGCPYLDNSICCSLDLYNDAEILIDFLADHIQVMDVKSF